MGLDWKHDGSVERRYEQRPGSERVLDRRFPNHQKVDKEKTVIAAINIFFVLAIAYSQYKHAKRDGMWSWYGFLVVIGSVGLFTLAFLIPAVNSTTLEAHPGVMITVLLSGILGFVAGLIYWARKYGIRAVQANAARAQSNDASKRV
jgi:hypothetical protein